MFENGMPATAIWTLAAARKSSSADPRRVRPLRPSIQAASSSSSIAVVVRDRQRCFEQTLIKLGVSAVREHPPVRPPGTLSKADRQRRILLLLQRDSRVSFQSQDFAALLKTGSAHCWLVSPSTQQRGGRGPGMWETPHVFRRPAGVRDRTEDGLLLQRKKKKKGFEGRSLSASASPTLSLSLPRASLSASGHVK